MSSTPHAARRETVLRVVDGSGALGHMTSAATEIRQLTRETLRVVGWEYELASRSLAWHAPIGSILAIAPRDTVSVAPSNGTDATSKDVAEWLVAPIVTTLQAGAPWRDYELQQRLESTDGEVQHFLVRARLVREGGHVVGCAGVVVDITDRHLVESNLRELIDRYRRLVDLSPDGIVVHQGGRIVYVNRAGVETVGATTAEEVLGRSIIDFIHPDSLGPTLERIATLSEEHPVSDPAPATLLRLDGTAWQVESVSVLTRWEGEDAFQVILRDLTDRKRAEAALRYQASLVEHVSDAIIGVDNDGRIESWNRAAELIYGVSAAVAVGSVLHDLVGLPVGFGEEPVRDMESVHRRHDDNLVIVRASVTHLFDDSGEKTGFVVVCADTTERRRAEDERRAVEQLHRTVIEAVDEGIVVADASGVIVAANPAARRILPLGVEIGTRLIDCVTGTHGVVGADRREIGRNDHPVARAVARNEALHDVLIGLLNENDTERWLSLSCRPLPATSGAAAGTVCSFADVTRVIQAQQELSYRATHDELTGLCNRMVFVDTLQHSLARSRRMQTNTAVLFIDIDRFKLVNDTLGHASGDEVLTEIAKRLEGATRTMDRVGRIAGDEFIVMCTDVTGIEPVAKRAAELERLIAEPIRLSNGRQPTLHASIGIAFAANGDGDAEELLRDAHVAMRRAKELGGTQIEIFDQDLRVQAERRRQLELGLRAAIDNDQIDVHYQPIVSVTSPRILGVEALSRFNHPELGSIPPTEFIHVAEETDLILSLGIAVLAKACKQAAYWRANDPAARDLYVSVNLSARQLYDPGLVHQVASVLHTTGLDPDALWLEITESVLMDDAPTAARIFASLRELGVHLVVDDFGTGYSSLAYLQAFPVEMLKIDRSFVMGLAEDAASEAIVRAIISLAGSLKLRVVAEGVEHMAQLVRLEQLGCDSFQGWLCSKARPPEELDFSVVMLAEVVS